MNENNNVVLPAEGWVINVVKYAEEYGLELSEAGTDLKNAVSKIGWKFYFKLSGAAVLLLDLNKKLWWDDNGGYYETTYHCDGWEVLDIERKLKKSSSEYKAKIIKSPSLKKFLEFYQN